MEPRLEQELRNQRKVESSSRIRSAETDLIVIGMLVAFAWFINSGIEIKGLYMDDLYLWSCYGEQSFLEYVFPIGGTRCRFIYYLAAWLEMALIGNRVSWFMPVNIIINSMVAVTVYFMAKNLSRERLIGFLCGFMYLLSRMAYYQISQVWGLMETLALWLAISILYLLFRFLNHSKTESYFTWAVVLYFLVCFVHERYMVLLPIFFLVLLMKKNMKWKEWIKPILCFFLIQGVRFIAIGGLAPAGTGGTDVADTLSIREAAGYAIRQVAYVFGINAGPGHLNGQNVMDSPKWILGFLLVADLALVIMVVLFLVYIIRNKNNRTRHLSNSLLFIVFIAGCIASSSVTIRLELRWVYVSFTAALLYLAYIYGALTEEKKNPGRWLKTLPMTGLLLLYTLAMIPVEMHYRSQYFNLYYWPNQLRYNSLAEETYEKYGDTIFGKSIYIIGNNYNMSQFTADTFFKVYDKNRKAEGTTVIHIDSYRDIGIITDQMLVLREEPEYNAFQDITGFLKDIKIEKLLGCYGDGWVDEEASLRIMTGAEGEIRMIITYPGNLVGGEILVVEYGDGSAEEWRIESNISHHVIKAEPYTSVPIKTKANFYMYDAQEQRGEKRLAYLMEVQVD